MIAMSAAVRYSGAGCLRRLCFNKHEVLGLAASILGVQILGQSRLPHVLVSRNCLHANGGLVGSAWNPWLRPARRVVAGQLQGYSACRAAENASQGLLLPQRVLIIQWGRIPLISLVWDDKTKVLVDLIDT